MDEPQIRFDDGAAYEAFMGKWSLLVGDVFVDWLSPARGLRWVDVGCGNGAFTALLAERCAPLEVQGLDPSDAQIEFARERLKAAPAAFRTGDAMALPYADDAFDAAVMALVIFFVPDPARGVAEMVRVVRPGGSVSAYAWDIRGGGFPFAALADEMEALGYPPLWPPSVDASRSDELKRLWTEAGCVDVELRTIEVARTFADFETFWTIAQTGPRVTPRIAGMSASDVAHLKERLRARVAPDPTGPVTYTARANAIKGVVGER